MMQMTTINHNNLSMDLSRTQIKEGIDEFNNENFYKNESKSEPFGTDALLEP